MAQIRMTVTLRDPISGAASTGEWLIDPTTGSPTLEGAVWGALSGLYTALLAAVAAAAPTLPPTLQ